MGWSWSLGRLAGIEIRIHATFLLLLLWVAWSRWAAEGSLAAGLWGVAFVVLVFGVVVLHELGHALTARRFGIKTPDITLLPIGGVARLERMPEDPRQELLVALAGPAVNVVLAGALALLLLLAGKDIAPADPVQPQLSFAAQLLWVNLVLAVFNMIPAFPMDGGRALRAILALRMPPMRATEVAATLGQGIALVLGFAGLFGNPVLLFIALFVWVGAAAEAKLVRMKSVMEGVPVDAVMIDELRVLRPGDALAVAVDHVLHEFQTDFPVVEDDGVVGVLTRTGMVAALAEHGPGGLVEDAMQTDFAVAHSHEMLEGAFERLSQSPCPAMPVIDDGVLVGMLTTDGIGELVSIRTALDLAARRLHPSVRRGNTQRPREYRALRPSA